MFKKLFGRKGRFQNSWMIIFSVALIVMGIYETINPTSSDTVASIFSNIKIVFGLQIVILGAIGLISTIAILVLEHKKIEFKNEQFQICFVSKLPFGVKFLNNNFNFSTLLIETSSLNSILNIKEVPTL